MFSTFSMYDLLTLSLALQAAAERDYDSGWRYTAADTAKLAHAAMAEIIAREPDNCDGFKVASCAMMSLVVMGAR